MERFNRMLPDRMKSMLTVMENHIKSGNSFMLNTEGQVIYHETNKGKYERGDGNKEGSNQRLKRMIGTSGPLDFLICRTYPFKNCMIVLDDEGLLKQLPKNELATIFFGHQFHCDVIVGNVVVSPGED